MSEPPALREPHERVKLSLMSEWPTTGNTPREIPGLDETVPPEERDVRISSDEGDYLPETPPDMMPRSTEWGTTPGEVRSEETIEQRIAQEEPDPDSAYGAPENESGLDDPYERVGGDDPDAISADDDFLGDSGRESADDSLDGPAEEAAVYVEGTGSFDDGEESETF